MFINNSLKEKIRTIGSEDDFASYLSKNQCLIYNMQGEFMNVLHEFGTTYNHAHMGILNALYYDQGVVDDSTFDLLACYARALYSHWDLENEDLSKTYILMLLFDRDMILNNPLKESALLKSLVRIFLGKIMDVYVASENPLQVVDLILDVIPLTYIIENSNNTSLMYSNLWNICSANKEYIGKEYIGDAMLLLKYVSDIYTNRTSCIECFVALHQMETGSVKYIESQNIIAKRYIAYFKDIDDVMLYIVNLISCYRGDNLDLDLRDFIVELKNQYDISIPVISVFLYDVLDSIKPSMDAYHYASIYETIGSSLLMHQNNQLLSPIIIPETSATESNVIFKKGGLEYALEAYKKDSVAINKGTTKIYHAYRTYKDAEDKVDSQISKAVVGMGSVLTGDVRTEIVEGKKFSAISLLKQVLGTVGLFAFGPVKAVAVLVVKYALKKNTTIAERKKIIMELESEIEMITEKIEDARGDGDREAKYSMMRTKTELNNALNRIKYGLEADQRSVSTAKATINSIRGK